MNWSSDVCSSALACLQLRGQARVGERLTAHRDEICFSRRDGGVANLGLYAARCNHRNTDRGLDPLRIRQVDRWDLGRVRSCIAFAAVDRVIGADRDRIDARSLGQPRSCNGLVEDRKSVVEGKRVSVSVDIGGRRVLNQKKNTKSNT